MSRSGPPPHWDSDGANGLQMIGIFVVLCSTDNLSLYKAHMLRDQKTLGSCQNPAFVTVNETRHQNLNGRYFRMLIVYTLY